MARVGSRGRAFADGITRAVGAAHAAQRGAGGQSLPTRQLAEGARPMRTAALQSPPLSSGRPCCPQVRGVVASALGVVAVGEEITVPPVTWLPNKLALVFSGAQFLQARRRPVIERLLQRFVDDLGPTFEVEASDPSPSLRLTRCFYHDFFEAEGEPLLAPLFTAQHGGTFEGVPGYSFEDDGDGRCRFVFDGVPP